MSANKAQEIIKRAMADRGVYDAMAARERNFASSSFFNTRFILLRTPRIPAGR
jgi:hypothetical protein